MKNYDKWNEVKKSIENKERKIGFKVREIFWVRIGQNVGSEEYGKGNEFQRPVLIVRKINTELFIGVPLTSQLKEDNDYFFQVSFRTKKGISNNSAMILQLKTFDKKRLMTRIGMLDKEQFNKTIKQIKRLFIPS
jgi:mRNA-degrading endonuclease toxin of MazEF toxin-antitoxin module